MSFSGIVIYGYRYTLTLRNTSSRSSQRKFYTVAGMELNDLRCGLNLSSSSLIMEYLVNISKRRAFWSLNEDILKINDSNNQYAVSIKEDRAYPCLHSPKTTKERSSIRRI
ncbi:hypothetical protein Tco_1016231 [Tanacetum coccineum]|uniref:Uncharacterized protein n=1 Tax=Tanacetum coccineum TaxID=301880 RepID=A0ABQ5FN06_9ASTR